MGTEIDRYHLNMYCRCLECKKRNRSSNEPVKSCEAYPEKNGIPPQIWNGKNVECPYFERNNNSDL